MFGVAWLATRASPPSEESLRRVCSWVLEHRRLRTRKRNWVKCRPRTTGVSPSDGLSRTARADDRPAELWADWDTGAGEPVIMLTDGVLLNVFTGARRQSEPADRIR